MKKKFMIFLSDLSARLGSARLGSARLGFFLLVLLFVLSASDSFAIDYNIKNDAGSFLFIDGNSRNVGIGTTTPTAKLKVVGSGVGTGTAFQVDDSSYNPKVTVLDNGNVGIGTPTPRVKLEVNNTAVFSTFVANTCNGTATIDWNAGNKQSLTLNGNCTTLNFTAPSGVGNFNLKIVNTGSYTITWPVPLVVKWPGGYAPGLTASGTDIVSFLYDGTLYYYGNASLDFK